MIPSIPQSPTADAAAALAAAAAPADLLNHCYRTYLFGRCVVPLPEVDEETAFVAAMLHDLGLTDTYAGAGEFDHVSVDVACRFLSAHGWDRDRIALVEQAILRHTNLIAEEVPVWRTVQVGVTIDVVGIGHDQLGTDTLDGILAAYPRLDFVPAMRHRVLDEARRHPTGSFARLEETVTLSDMIVANPLDALTTR